jgi:hypothetical protein
MGKNPPFPDGCETGYLDDSISAKICQEYVQNNSINGT